MRVILPEPRQHSRMYRPIKIIHDKRAEDGDIVFVGELIEEVFEVHARGDISSFPKNIDHFAPPPHFRIAPRASSFTDYFCCETEEHRCIGHSFTHKTR